MADSFDWICVGSGTSGLAAAIFGHDLGMKTLLLEKTDKIGGTTAQGAGLLYVPLNHLMGPAGIADSREEAFKYLQFLGTPYYSPEHQTAFVDTVPRAVEHLGTKAGVRFRISEMIDFWARRSDDGWMHDDRDVGAKRQGRSLICEPFPAARLGEWRDKVRLDVFYHGLAEVLEGQEHNPSLGRLTTGATLGPSIGHSGPLRDRDTLALRLWRERVGPKLDRLLAVDEEHRVGGAALVSYLLRACLDRGVDVRLNASARELVTENGRVVGLTVRTGGNDRPILARKGVLLATGGGNGWRMAAGAGADIRSSPNLPALPSFSVPDEGGASRSNYENRMRHSIMVNRFGDRFGDEVPYQGLMTGWLRFDAHEDHRWANIPNYLIFDRQAIEKYSFAGRPPGATEGLDWLAKGESIAELARNLNVPAPNLEATVKRFNANVTRGRDADFHRLPETLGALEKPPFYGVQCTPPNFDPMAATMSPVVDCNGQMLDYETHQPIPGLYGAYAGAELSQIRKMIFGYGYTAGLGQAASIAFDLLAAEHAARS